MMEHMFLKGGENMLKIKDERYSAYILMGYKADGSEKRKYVHGTTPKEVEQKLFNLKMTIAQEKYAERR